MNDTKEPTVAVPARAQLLFIPHTHWDREWYLPLEQFRYRLVRVMDTLLEILEQDPSYASFHFDGQTIVLQDYEEIQGRSERLRALIRAGRIKVGPWFVLPDEFMVSGESLLRNLELGFRVSREFGSAPAPAGYLPDMFGHLAQMPQILRGFGLETALMWRGITPDVTENEFIWEALDGSRVFTVFLPLGYGVAAGLPRNQALLLERVMSLVAAAPVAGEDQIVALLCGTDHTPPEADTPASLRAALKSRPGWSFEFSEIAEWIQRLREKGEPKISHQGELRTSGRTLILPSVASARLYLKQQDFAAEASLTRYAEPFAALARAFGGMDCRGFLDYAWRLLLSNHPHDSICGCSVDAVHDEMETRSAKVRQVSEQVAGESMNHALSKLGHRGPALAIFQPCSLAGPRVVIGEIEGRIKPGTCLLGDDGAEYPLQVLETLDPGTMLLDADLDRAPAMALLGQSLVEDIAGLYLHRMKLGRGANKLEVDFELGESPAGLTPEDVREEVESALADSAIQRVRVRAKKQPRSRVAARLPASAGPALKSFSLVRNKEAADSGLQVGPGQMENELVKVQFEPGGTCLVTDKSSGLGYRCLRIIDVGDRGDSYNFDPVPEDALLCEPDKVALKALTSGPVAAVMEIRHRFRVPESLHASREGRSHKRVPLDLATSVTLYRGYPRVDFRTSFVNTAKDHRLQVAVRLPYETDEVRVESAFGLVTREITPTSPPKPADPADLVAQLLGREGTYGTSPQKTATLVRHGAAGLALINRGLAEMEAVKLEGATRIAMTMVRAVGWLSRGDLIMRPGNAGPPLPAEGAQCLRPFTWDYAVMPFAAPEGEAEAVAAAHAFAYPPRLYMLNGRRDAGETEFALIKLDNPKVLPSALRPLAGGGLEVRLVNYSVKPEAFTLRCGPWWRDPATVDFKGDPIEVAGANFAKDSVAAELRPFQILTIHFQAAT